MTALAPADIEAGARAVLLDIAGHVATRLPAGDWPGKVVRITRTGGEARTLIQSDPRLLIECYATGGSTAAFDLARLAYARLWAAQNAFWLPDVFVTRVVLSEPVNFPDPETPDHDRYQFLATATTSLVEIA